MYSQFIYGKLVSNRGSEYQLVARSADLTNELNLKTMAEGTHRFWGSTPPENPKVVGIFLQGDNLVLVKAETAVYQNGQLAVNGVRGFDQHRYVFIPVTSMSALQGRAFKLLLWMFKQPIPLLTEFNANLELLSIPIVEEPISADIDKEIAKIRQCWPDSNEQKPLVLSGLAAIINGKRLLLTNEQTGIPPQNWMESILLLLPASIRPQISVAVGTLDEQQCPWATLVVKTNQHYSRSLPENMIWLNRANQTFDGQPDESTFENSYVDYILDHITTAPNKDTLKRLIQQLDTIADNDITLESLADPKIIVRLIRALPEKQQNEFLLKYLSGLSIDIWDLLIQLISKEDYQQGFVFACKEIVRLIPALPKEKQDECLTKYLSGLSIDIWDVLIPLIIKEDYQQGRMFACQEIVRLIPALPEQKQNECLTKYLSGLTIHIWDVLIPLIIKEDYQQGLMFAWKELAKNAIFEPQAITLMLRVWSRLVNAKLVLLLDELGQNLPLAEILLKQGLLEQNRRESKDPEIVLKFIGLCTSLVADKAKSDFSEAWELATNHLAPPLTKFFFQTEPEKETFSLLDTALLGEVPVEVLSNRFTSNLAGLLPSIEVEQFKQSNLRRQLTTKNPKVAELLDTLVAEGNSGLAKLPQIAHLIGINNAAKDNWYATFLKKWSPSWEQSKLLLVEVIKETPNSRNNFSRDDFRQTYTWFEQQQPGLKAIFDSFQQNYSCENWVNLAQAVYDNPQDKTEFVDTLVGNIFPVAVMQKWLPLIVDNENVRKNFLATSSAWQSLTIDNLNQLVRSFQEYVPTLTRCLRDGSRLDWIKGDLLHYLCRTWIEQKKVDEDLKNFVTSPSVTNTFTNNDWLNLQRLSWEPEIDLELPLGVKTALTPDLLLSLQSYAKTIIPRYTCPKQTRKLLNDCKAWGLSFTEQKDILKAALPQACNADLIIPYLYYKDKAINPAEEQKLIGLLLQLQLNNEEREEISDLEKFSVEAFTQYILPNKNMTLLKWWRDKAVEKELYKEAFSSAAQKYVQKISITDFLNYLEDLKKSLLVEESSWMSKPTFSLLAEYQTD